MRYIKRILIFFTLFMAAALYTFISLNKSSNFTGRDIVYYNDMIYSINDDYSAGSS